MSLRVGQELKIPSPIDIHAHLRQPGGTDKETIASGTYAALRGGYQAVFDMPNNPGGCQTWTRRRLDEKYRIGRQTARTDIGFYAGIDLADPNLDQIPLMISRAAGLKLYFGHTTGNTKEFGLDQARKAIDQWLYYGQRQPAPPPILIHAREEVGAEVADYVAGQGYPVHWCHVSTTTEVLASQRLRQIYGQLFSAGVTPHHLTMTARDADLKYGWPGGRMMPPLGNEVDGEALLAAIDKEQIQIIETDHAPHTAKDKLAAERDNPTGDDSPDCNTCFGVSGIEFVLPVMISLVQRRQIRIDRLLDALYTQPARLLSLKTEPNTNSTTIKVEPYVIGEDDLAGQSRNHPYVGWTAWGRVERVISQNRVRYDRQGPVSRDWRPRVLTPGDKL